MFITPINALPGIGYAAGEASLQRGGGYDRHSHPQCKHRQVGVHFEGATGTTRRYRTNNGSKGAERTLILNPLPNTGFKVLRVERTDGSEITDLNSKPPETVYVVGVMEKEN